MSRLWRWDFEERRAPLKPPLPPAPDPAPDESATRTATAAHDGRRRYRRRRAGALLGCVAAIALIVAAVSSSGHPRRSARTLAREEMSGARRADAAPREASQSSQNAAVAAVLGYTPFVREGGARAREVALTFDDGPGPYTPQLLSVLERYRVKATFFVIGKMLRYFGASTVREIEDGDVIGDHTETHPMMALLSPHEQREQLFEQILRVEALGGRRPALFRPPYGSFDAATMRALHALHLLMVLWSTDTQDYRQPGVGAIVERALAGVHPGSIILMHDAGGARTQTIAALPAIIRALRDRGYRLVTVPQLLLDDPPSAGQPLPSSLAGD